MRQYGFKKSFSIIVSQYKVIRWKLGRLWELAYWEIVFHRIVPVGADDYGPKLDPNLRLQQRPSALLPPQTDVTILDVGAGPLTFLGKVSEGKNLSITAIDPLADQYNKLLGKRHITPLVRTQKLAAEELLTRFPPNSFDLVYARNCLDHSYDPERAILQLIEVVKRGRYVLLEHVPNQGTKALHVGLHQWDFTKSSDGDFLIKSAFMTVNMTRKYAERCTITCEIIKEKGDWIITRILKHDTNS
jgi:SAM-dependent methyltransferase